MEDRTFVGRTTVTVGSAEDCTFLVPPGDVPTRATVFQQTKHGANLHFAPGADGTVNSVSLSALEGQTTRSSDGRTCTLALDAQSKGRISLGEVSLIFQFVEPPQAPVPAPLPKGARGLVAQLDRSFLVVLAISLTAHFAGVGWISTQPVPEERDLSMDEQVDRFSRVTLPLPKLQPTTPPPQDTSKPAVAEVVPVKAPVVAAPSTAVQKEARDRFIKESGMLALIGSRRDGAEGALGDLLRDSPSVGDVTKAMAEAGGLRVASVEDATAAKRKGNETGTTETLEPMGTDGVKRVVLDDRAVAKLNPTVKTEVIEVGGPELDEQALSRWLNQRKSAVQSCYERELKRQPTLAGRMVIRFSVTSRGRVERVGFGDDTLHSNEVQSCISTLMRAWVLPFTPEEEVPVSLPFIFSATR